MSKRIAIIVFFILLFLPILFSIFEVGFQNIESENRRLEEKPEFELPTAGLSLNYASDLWENLIKFKKQYTVYYEDNFVLKSILFATHSAIQTKIFNTNPIPHKVVKGEDGWYFLGNSYSNVISESKGFDYFTDTEINQIEEHLEERNDWLNQHGISYYVAIAPNKHTIYGDFLPILQNNHPTKLMQLNAAFRNSKINFIDLTSPLKKNTTQKLYDKTGTHWNYLGAYFAYQDIIKTISKLHPEVKAISNQEITIRHDTVYQEGLTKMLDIELFEDQIQVHINKPKAKQILSTLQIPSSHIGLESDYEYRFSCPNKPLKILIFRDSFSTRYMSMMAETFGEALFIWSYRLDKDLILKEKPDIVITEMVERSIEELLQK